MTLILYIKLTKIYTQVLMFRNQLFYVQIISFNVYMTLDLSPSKRDNVLRRTYSNQNICFLKCRNSSDPLDSQQCSQTACKSNSSFYFPFFLKEFWGNKTTSKYYPSFFRQPWFPFKHLVLLNVEDMDTLIRYSPGQNNNIGEINTALLLIKVSM